MKESIEIKNLEVKNKRVLVRCDFNVPLDEKGNILNDFRIKKSIPTIEYLIKKESKIILMSHLGDPEGKKVEKLKMDKVQERLTEYLDLSVTKAPDCVGKKIEKYIRKEMKTGEVLILENLRFHKGEKNRSSSFSKSLSKMGDIYINEAFGVSHRDHASITGVPRFLQGGVGFLFQKEIESLRKVIENPALPMIALIGGTKVKTKIKPINKILKVADFLLVGNLIRDGLKENGISVNYPEKLIYPIDGVVENGKELDIGEETQKIFCDKIAKAKTIFWNGPFGKTEEDDFSEGTKNIAKSIIESGAFSIVGGGETIEFLNRVGLISKFDHVSTGGGAMLDFIGEETLPGLKALKN